MVALVLRLYFGFPEEKLSVPLVLTYLIMKCATAGKSATCIANPKNGPLTETKTTPKVLLKSWEFVYMLDDHDKLSCQTDEHPSTRNKTISPLPLEFSNTSLSLTIPPPESVAAKPSACYPVLRDVLGSPVSCRAVVPSSRRGPFGGNQYLIIYPGAVSSLPVMPGPVNEDWWWRTVYCKGSLQHIPVGLPPLKSQICLFCLVLSTQSCRCKG